MKKVFLSIFILMLCLIFYGVFVGTKGFKVNSKTIEIQDLSDSFDGFKILQLSDFLIKDVNELKNIENISKKINDLKPDIIIFTGDLLYKNNNLTESDLEKLVEILKNMECSLYKYAVVGDNDEINSYKDIMFKSEFKVLDNESDYIFYKDIKPIKITGLTNLNDVSNAMFMEDNLETMVNIVITHYPDYFETLKNEDINIVFAGHSLNGQVIVPFYGGLIKSDMAKKYVYGSYQENDSKLFISGGIGTPKIQFRLFNKPEINLYKFKKIASN